MAARLITATTVAVACAFAAGASLAQPALTPARKDVEILPIYRNFVASKAAAAQCKALDEASDRRFASKFPAVAAEAAQTLRQRHPDASKTDIDRRMKAMDQEAHEAVRTEIAKNGCTSPAVRWLVQQYKSPPAHR
jgi:hypothetical protein